MIRSIIHYLIHGIHVYNELQLQSKNKLTVDYNDNRLDTSPVHPSPDITYNICRQHNYSLFFLNNPYLIYTPYNHTDSIYTTDIIPNIINRYSFEVDKGEEVDINNNNNLLSIFEDIWYVIIPIVILLFLIMIVAKCRKVRYKRTRPISSIKQLKQTTSLSYINLNDSTESSSIIINSLV